MQEPAKKSRSCLLLTLILLGTGLLLIALLGLLALRFDWKAELRRALLPDFSAIKNLHSDFLKKYQFVPTLIVNSEVRLTGVHEILEFSNAEGLIHARQSYTHQFLASTKQLEIEGSFKAKAGFRLNNNFRILADTENKTLTIELPAPELLSLSPEKIEFLKDKDGWWNQITSEERNENLQLLLQEASRSPELKPLLLSSQKNIEELLTSFLRKAYPDYSIQFIFEGLAQKEVPASSL
ncbi:MAG: DUF4230 domain-containing protein [Chthoniobacterales bacterium]